MSGGVLAFGPLLLVPPGPGFRHPRSELATTTRKRNGPPRVASASAPFLLAAPHDSATGKASSALHSHAPGFLDSSAVIDGFQGSGTSAATVGCRWSLQGSLALPQGVATATATTTTTTTTTAPHAAFDPVLPDASTWVGMAAIVALSVLAVSLWATQVVPVSRANLAVDKKRGPLRTYLDGLLDAEDADRDFVIDAIRQVGDDEVRGVTEPEPSPAGLDDIVTTASRRGRRRTFERWLFSDWLSQSRQRWRKKRLDHSIERTDHGENDTGGGDNDPTTAKETANATGTAPSRRGRRKPPALPGLLPAATWNSGDNPVLVASALIGLGVLATSIAENVPRWLH